MWRRIAVTKTPEVAANETYRSSGKRRAVSQHRHLVEVPDRFALARWSRDADLATIARCILATLKYEPHIVDTTALRRALKA